MIIVFVILTIILIGLVVLLVMEINRDGTKIKELMSENSALRTEYEPLKQMIALKTAGPVDQESNPAKLTDVLELLQLMVAAIKDVDASQKQLFNEIMHPVEKPGETTKAKGRGRPSKQESIAE